MANCRYDFKLIFLVFCILTVTLAGRCKHGGKENQAGGCDCTPCYSGETCEEIVNQQPKFDTLQQEVTVDTEYRENELVYVVSAYDKDDEICNDVPSCPCGEITYGIKSGNEDKTFTIDTTLGIIRLNGFQDIGLQENERRQLVLSARNKFDESAESTMTLGVRGKAHRANQYSAEVNNGYDGTYHVDTASHERVKRAANAPSNVTFELKKETIHSSLTTISPGQRVGFELKIDFPAGTTDMLVELFAPDNNSIVMMLCDVKVASIGADLVYDGPGDIKLDSKNNSIFYDWAVIDFGNVTNSYATADEHSIVIKYDAVMIQNDATVNGNLYWVSAGAEYNDENEVWVGQASFTTDIITVWDASGNKPQFNLSGPSSLAVGESAIFAVDMYITYPSIGLGFDAFAPLNDTSVMSICGIQIEGVGVNYQCGLDYTTVPSTLHQDGQPRGNARGHLDIGLATNKGIRDAPNSVEPNLIRVEFVMKVWDDVTTLGPHSIGAALELGSDQIWCGQIEVNIVARKTIDIASPSLTLAFVGNTTEVSESQPVVVEITADVGVSTGDFILDVQSPLDGSNNPKLQVCAVKFIRAGENMPCVESDREAVVTVRGNQPLVPDTVTLDLGVLTNVGNWGYFNHTLNETRNIMVFQFLVKGTAFTDSSQSLDIGLTSGSGTRISLINFTINKASSTLPEITDTPMMNLTYKYSGGTVRIGEAVTMFYEISTLRGQTFPKFDMEFIAPNSSDSAIVSICRAETITVGKNTPCLTKNGIDSKWEYVSQFNDSTVDRATLSLGSICNFEVTDNATEDVLVLAAVFQLKPHADATNGKQMYLSAGSQYTESKMWIGQLSMTADTSAYPAPAALKKPALYLSKVGEFTAASTPIGYPATYEVLIQTFPGETIDLKLVLSTTSNMISFCSITIKAVGTNMPCVDKTIKGVISKDPATGLNKDAEITVGPVTNVGDIDDASAAGNSTFGINSLVLEVILQSSIAATDGDILPFTVGTNGLITPVTNENLVVTSTTTGIAMLGNATGIEFKVAAVVDNDANYDVYKGQAKKFFIDIDTQLDTTQRVTVQLMTSVGSTDQFEIAYIALVEVGENLGCVSREMTSTTYVKRTSSLYIDIGTVNLGYVCNTGINRNESEANKIRIEAYARLLNNPALNVGDVVSLSAAVNFNDEQIFIAQKDMTIKNVTEFSDLITANATLTNGSAINVNHTSTPIIMNISQVETIPVILNIPPFTVSLVQFDIDLPMSPATASMTLTNVKIVGSGQNLCRYGYTEDYTVTELSTQGTTQINKAFVDMGIVSNIGITHKLGTNIPEDDIIYAEVEVQMADSDSNADDAEMWLGLGAKIASFIIVSELKVKVSRDGYEEPVFNFTAAYDSVNSTDVYAEIDVYLEHASNSTAEYQNTVLKFNTPPYLEYKAITAVNPTAPAYTVNNINNNAIEISLNRFFFTDKLEMTVAFEVNSTYGVPPGIGTSAAVTGVEIICNMVERNLPEFRNGSQEFTSGFVTVDGAYTTTPKTSGSSCTAGVITNIETCQFSSSGDDIATPDNAIYTGTGWVPPVREGKLGKLRYLQYDFGERVSLTQIAYKHTKTEKITKIQLRYSNDGISFLDGELLTIGAIDGSVSVNSILKYKVLRLYVDEVTVAVKPEVGLAVQFTGCYVDTTPSAFTCPTLPIIPAEYGRRSFVADSTHVYVCDGTPGKRSEIDTMCFASSDGNNWKAMDNRVSCMIGHNQDPKGDERLYALSYNYQYMTSNDKGDTWQVVEQNHVDQVKTMGTYTQAVKVPWTGSPTDTNKSLLTWQSAYEGMSPAGAFVNKFKWDTCCP